MFSKEKKKEYDASRYLSDPKKAEIRSRKWSRENPDKKREGNHRWYVENKERLKEKASAYYRENKAACKRRMKKYRKEHPEIDIVKHAKRKAQKLKSGGSFTIYEWKCLCVKYSHRCLCCNKRKKLTADHVIPVSKGGSSNIENIQPLCRSCNSKKKDKSIDFRRKSCKGKILN